MFSSLHSTCRPLIGPLALALGLLGICSCNHALPAKAPLQELKDYAARAEKAEQQARQHLEQARAERDRAEALFAQAKSQFERAQQAQTYCAEIARKIPKPQKRIVCPKPEEKPEAVKEEEKKQQEPPYSPSDAPVAQ